MNQEQMERKIEDLQHYDKHNLSESIQLIYFYNQVTDTGEIPLIMIAHKHLKDLVIEVIGVANTTQCGIVFLQMVCFQWKIQQSKWETS